jgi:hypothetical protein
VTVLKWIKDRVDITDFIQTFKGEFWGVQYSHEYPQPRQFQNAKNCEQFVGFINSELQERIRSGAIYYVGKVGEVAPPYIVSPITIEPTKPRLCINLMYLNCFMKDTPFSLDTLSEVPKIVKKNSFLTKLDDKSGYDNVLMSENSKSLLGFQWGGHYFQCNTLPFGWKNSAFVYHTLNLQAISRSASCLLYIDDRLIEEFNGYLPPQIDNTTTRAKIAIHLAVKLFVSL